VATFKITISGKGLQSAAVEKLADQFKKTRKDVSVTLSKVKESNSRNDRFAEAIGMVSDAKSEFENLRDELSDWKEGLPENLQQSPKADELDSAISELEDAISTAEDLESKEVSFPGMY
jgi:predicted  nucleic acid-binding Zn-ribbon protein